MRVSRVTIRRYRSLYDVSIEPRPFSAVAGPNNAGKSNLADALHFLGETHRHGLEIALSRKGGYEGVAYRRRRRTKSPLHFAIAVDLSYGEVDVAPFGPPSDWAPSLRVEHAFSFRAESESITADFRIEYEHLRILAVRERGEPRLVFSAVRRGQELDFSQPQHLRPRGSWQDLLDPLTDESFQAYVSRRLTPTVLLTREFRYNSLLQHITDGLARTRIYQLAPPECRRAGAPTPNPELDPHGGNLPAVIHFLQRNHKHAWRNVVRAMRKLVPTLEDVETIYTPDRRLAVTFREQGAGRGWSSQEISDGTIQSLALYVSLFDPRPALAIIEEPENSVHAWVVRQFVDACRAVPEKQLVVTTHSPALLGYLSPEELFIAWRNREGQTEVAPLNEIDHDAQRLWESGEFDVFELLDAGWLREAIPSGMHQ